HKLCLQLLLLLTAKVYAAWAKAVPPKTAAYTQTAAANASDSNKWSNYFLHEPYGPHTYAFGYELQDKATGNVQFRDERRYLNGSLEGSYGYVRPDGLVQVTRYRADEASGYLAQTQTFAAGEEGNLEATPHWPTKRPDLFREQHVRQPAQNVSWDAKQHLNVSVDAVEHELAEQLKQQLGLDLNHINVAQDVQPAVLDIVNGKTQLQGNASLQSLQNLLPKELPIVPFELPVEQLIKKAPAPNDEKALPLAKLSSTLATPKPLSSNASANWYQQIIQANRREFL
ncbi:CG34462, partial [Drosophila busckii]